MEQDVKAQPFPNDGRPFGQLTRQELINELHYWEAVLRDDQATDAAKVVCRRHADRCLEFLRGASPTTPGDAT